MHAHLWLGREENDRRLLLEAVARYGIERVIVSTLAGFFPNEEDVALANSVAYDFSDAHSECISAYVYVSPEHPNALSVLRHGVEDRGAIGVKIWVSEYCDAPCVNPLVEYCTENGIPILIHSFHKATGQVAHENVGTNVANLARRYPQAKLIMAHLGGNCYHGVPAVRDCQNVFCDFSGSIFRGDELNYAVHFLGAERLLYGTDMPGSYVVNLGQVLEADLTEKQREQILSENTRRVFDRNYRLE